MLRRGSAEKQAANKVLIGLIARGEERLEAAKREVEKTSGKALVLPTAASPVVHLPSMNTPRFSGCRTRLPRPPQPVPPIFQPEVAASRFPETVLITCLSRFLGLMGRTGPAAVTIASFAAITFAAARRK